MEPAAAQHDDVDLGEAPFGGGLAERRQGQRQPASQFGVPATVTGRQIDGIDGVSILRAAALLEALPDADRPSLRRNSRPYRRATPKRVAEILALTATSTPIRVIAETVGLSSGTVMRVRRIHRVLPHASWPFDCLGSAD